MITVQPHIPFEKLRALRFIPRRYQLFSVADSNILTSPKNHMSTMSTTGRNTTAGRNGSKSQ
jgi:hypothetical protein